MPADSSKAQSTSEVHAMTPCCANLPIGTCSLHFTRKPVQGFTLIEVMIVVAIIGILAAIAMPSYTESIRKGRRADAVATLVDVEQYMRRFYGTRDTYAGVTLPTSLTQVPSTGPAYYQVQFLESGALVATSGTPVGFTVRLTRAGAMAGDRCGDLQVTQSGTRSLLNEATGNTLASCFPGS